MNPAAAPIGQTLLNLGLISADQLHIALREQGRAVQRLTMFGLEQPGNDVNSERFDQHERHDAAHD